VKLYDHPRSSSSHRVRIGLHLKGLEFERVVVHLLRDGGEQHTTSYRELNPESEGSASEAQR
jgi:maleylacetoacetate isomerase